LSLWPEKLSIDVSGEGLWRDRFRGVQDNHEGRKAMPEISVPEDVFSRISDFKRVVEAIMEEAISLDNCVVLILSQGVDSMLADILSAVAASTLLRSFQQLGSKHPAQVYSYVAETLKGGAAAQKREMLRRKIGFLRSGDAESEAR